MSIPLDRLYHYIESVASEIRNGGVLIYRFWPHGSKNINDLHCTRDHTVDENTYFPHVICYDQEPLNYNMYKNTPVRPGDKFVYHGNSSTLPKRNLRVRLGNIYDQCLLLHSEQNSLEVAKYQQEQFVPVYYWSHALIARDWFRYAPYIKNNKNPNKIFLIYNRAWSGTREYRLKFTELLIHNDLLEHCRTSFNPYDTDCYYKDHNFSNNNWKPVQDLEQYITPTLASSNYSADFDINDYDNTEFEVVLETLFDDQRQQLTEKILRPIACKQPFILASTAGSLKYLRSYGFQTFEGIFDESYDSVLDPVDRMQHIVKVMKEISSWSTEYKISQMKKIQKITEHNHQHFFSDKFINTVVNELRTNLRSGFDYIENNNIGLSYRDTKIKNIAGIRQDLKKYHNNNNRMKALKKIKEYRKRNCTWVK